MARLDLSLGCWNYDRTRALQDGSVKPDGIEINFLEMPVEETFFRMVRHREFDVSEMSLSSYTVTLFRDPKPFIAIPVFTSRLFRHSCIYVNAKAGIREPKDLIGKRVGAKTFQATAILWLRGILEHEYGVPQTSIEWFCELDEVVEFAPPLGVKITRLEPGQSVEAMLAEGKLDAVLHPDRIEPIRHKDPRVAQLFPNFKDEEIAYFRKTRMFPIMHLLAIRQEIADRHPWVAVNILNAFNEAKRIAMKRMANPRVVPLVWYRVAWEEQEEIVGPDPWEHGATERNIENINTIAGYAYEQGLTKQKFTFDDLFPRAFQAT
jgi:4,5-dihydroxyphthalate decarboxylase